MKYLDFKKISRFCLWIVIICVFTSFLGNYYYFFDLFSHFFLQLFVATVLLIPFFIYFKDKQYIITGTALSIFLLFFISKTDLHPLYTRNFDSSGEIMFQNVYFWNNKSDDIVTYIRQKTPRTVALVEPNRESFEKILKLNLYKFSFYKGDEAKSLAVFSNEEVTQHVVVQAGEYPVGFFRFKDYDLFVVHPFPPFNDKMYDDQKVFFNYMKEFLTKENKKGRKFLVVGDFNSSVYSRVFQNAFGDLEFHPIYSWATDTFLAIPIDYAISNSKIEVSPGSKLSSDHIPLHINFK